MCVISPNNYVVFDDISSGIFVDTNGQKKLKMCGIKYVDV